MLVIVVALASNSIYRSEFCDCKLAFWPSRSPMVILFPSIMIVRLSLSLIRVVFSPSNVVIWIFKFADSSSHWAMIASFSAIIFVIWVCNTISAAMYASICIRRSEFSASDSANSASHYAFSVSRIAFYCSKAVWTVSRFEIWLLRSAAVAMCVSIYASRSLTSFVRVVLSVIRPSLSDCNPETCPSSVVIWDNNPSLVVSRVEIWER